MLSNRSAGVLDDNLRLRYNANDPHFISRVGHRFDFFVSTVLLQLYCASFSTRAAISSIRFALME